MRGGFGICFFSKDWLRRTAKLHEAVRGRVQRAMEQLANAAPDISRQHREVDSKLAAGQILREWEAELMFIAGNSMTEFHTLRRSSVRDYLIKFESKIKELSNGGIKGTNRA